MYRDSRRFSLIRRLTLFRTKAILQFPPPPPCGGSFIGYPDHHPAQFSITRNPTSTNAYFLIRFFTSLRLGEPSPHSFRARPGLVFFALSCLLPCCLLGLLLLLFVPCGPLFMGSVDNATLGNKRDRLPAEAKKILQSLSSGWDDIIDSNALQVIPLKGAMTNEVYQIKWLTNTDRSRKVLVRIYGEGVEVFFDRENEIRTFEFMSKKGQGPQLLGRFSNGRIEEFIRARTLSAPDMRDPEISVLIATKTKEFHNLDLFGPKTVLLWDRLRNWLGVAKSTSSPEEAKAFRLDSIEQEIYELENSLCGDQRIGFCHNDLQYGNIMIDEETRLITIIDYEYACYNPVAFDIANHFCEMAADYHSESPHVLDYNKYPDYNERRRFLHVYLSCSGEEPNDLEIEQLVQEVEKYALASHLFWGLWGFISEHVNEIDFDYMEYARQRFQQYWLRRPELLGSFTDAVVNDR